jgi:hypothetical protein
LCLLSAPHRADVEMQIGTSVDVEGIVRLTGIHTPEAT